MAVERVQLHPYVTYNPLVEAQRNEHWSRIWQVAAMTSAIALILVETAALISLNQYLKPHFFAVAVVVSFIGVSVGLKTILNMQRKSTAYAYKATEDRKIYAYSLDVEKIMRTAILLSQLGFPQVASYPSLAYRFCYYEDLCDQARISANTQKFAAYRKLASSHLLHLMKHPSDLRACSDFFSASAFSDGNTVNIILQSGLPSLITNFFETQPS